MREAISLDIRIVCGYPARGMVEANRLFVDCLHGAIEVFLDSRADALVRKLLELALVLLEQLAVLTMCPFIERLAGILTH